MQPVVTEFKKVYSPFVCSFYIQHRFSTSQDVQCVRMCVCVGVRVGSDNSIRVGVSNGLAVKTHLGWGWVVSQMVWQWQLNHLAVSRDLHF